VALPLPLHTYTYSDYLALEEHSLVRHEFVGGEIYAMAGGTPEHAALAASVLRLLGNALPQGCRAYSSDLRVRIEASDVTTYPDATIVCGALQLASQDPLAVTNPVLLVEVTSASTDAYDRGAKLEQYKLLPSVQEVLLVSHKQRQLSVHRRRADGAWTVSESFALHAVTLESISTVLRVEDVYRDSAVA
jgi:Uma2 family endonuclease